VADSGDEARGAGIGKRHEASVRNRGFLLWPGPNGVETPANLRKLKQRLENRDLS